MGNEGTRVLTVNAGSSSLKFALFQAGESLSSVVGGKFERIGSPGARLSFTDAAGKKRARKVKLRKLTDCVPELLKLLQDFSEPVGVIVHRIVHGGAKYSEPQRVTGKMLRELKASVPFDPEHLPAAIKLIEEFGKHYDRVAQVACFDTAFHSGMPRGAKLLPLPRKYDAKGIQRYGFHGLSYGYLMEELGKLEGGKAAKGKLILAHLGHGASLAAVRDGKSVDTTMSFTPTAGLVMSTRTGDLDPGVLVYLARSEGLNGEQLSKLVNEKAGLLGISETSSDTRDLLQREHKDRRAAEAIELFCYQAKKSIGAMVAALNGLDGLVFTGGIGENAAELRARICAGLDCFGIKIEARRNDANKAVISRAGSKVTVRVMKTNEEIFMARLALAVMKKKAEISRRDARGAEKKREKNI